MGTKPRHAEQQAKKLNTNGNGHVAHSVNGDTTTLHPLGEKIFLDRYALKDGKKQTVAVGDTVIVATNLETGQREIGTVIAMDDKDVTIELRDGEQVQRHLDHIDKPLETHPGQMLDRVAAGMAAIETAEKQDEWQQKFRWLLDDWKFVPGGRILTAAGTDQNLTFYNCYVIPSPKDSREGIMSTLTQMTEIMSRGGGVGLNVSSLRPRHAYVRGVNGRSSGAVSWGELYSFVTGLIEQGGSRRGALMIIMNVWHPDVVEFINSKRTMGRITNANISVGITDDFMEAVKKDADWDLIFPDTSYPDYDETWDGDLAKWQADGKPIVVHKTVKARDIWHSIIESAWASAEPGVFFMERYNKLSNSWYYAPILCTNPCVTGDTLIYTADGLRTAYELYQQQQDVDVVLDRRFGQEESTSQASHVFKTGTKPVFKLRTKEGYSLRATADHRIMTPRGWVELQDLQPGDAVHILSRRGQFGTEGSLELGRVLGWLVGDGTLKKNEAVLSFFGEEKRELAPMFADHVNDLVSPLTVTRRTYEIAPIHVQDRDEARIGSTRLYSIAEEYGLAEIKHRVPVQILHGSEAVQCGFLQALFTADGTFLDGGKKGGSIRLAANALDLLEQVQLLLLNFGIASRIYQNRRDAGYRSLPDGKGGLKEYWCEAQHELVISKQNMVVFADQIGFLMAYKQEKLRDYIERGKRGPYTEKFIATVESITADAIEDVYDLTEPLTHSFIANGFVVHNCGEQGLPAWGVCNLGALNLSKFVTEAGEVAWDDLGAAVRYAVRFLDNVIDATPYFFEENAEQQLGERRVGLGTMGLAEMMIRLKIRYGSEKSQKFLDKLYGFIASEAYLASAENAAEKGPFSQFDVEKFLQSGFMKSMPSQVREAIREKGIRNVTLLTQAPTGTTGTMVNTSTGIEPFYFWSFHRKGRMGTHEERVNVYDEWLTDYPNQPLPDYFVTAMDLTPEEHVRVQAAIQRWIDSSISKTCNVPNEYTVEQTKQLYELMYELGCKGGTIYRDGSRDVQVLNLKDDDKKETEPPKAPDIKWRVRPATLVGKTYRKNTPIGTAYITVNTNGENGNEPFEAFINVGKVGSDVAADAEGLGRLISLILRMPSPLTPQERVQDIVAQLRGIGSGRQQGFGRDRVMSMPDAVAKVLAEHAGFSATEELPGLPDIDEMPDLDQMEGDLCPSCGSATLYHVEGCKKCYDCGFSEC